MVQSTNCIIILVPIPSLPRPPFLTALISCKHNCRFSPLRNTVYPRRKLTIHFGNPPPNKTPRKTASHAEQYYTAAIQNATFKANQNYRSVICSSYWQILPLPHFYIPQNDNPHNKTPALTRLDNTANFAFNPISCFTQLRMRYTRQIQKPQT